MSQNFEPYPGLVPLGPPPTGWAAPDEPAVQRRPRSRTQAGPVQPTRRRFRRSFFDRQDPFESAGTRVDAFTVSGSYAMENVAPRKVAAEIQAELVNELRQGNVADVEVEVIDFDDASLRQEAPRRFIVSRTDTHRRTLVTVNAYIYPYGQHLYYAVRSYLLPPLSWWKLAAGILWATALIFAVTYFHPVLAALRLGSIFGPRLLVVGVLGFTFRKLIRNLLGGDHVVTALRKQFPARIDLGTFDGDDVGAFLKTNWELTIGTICTTLERYGINTGRLRQAMATLQTVNISTSINNFGTMAGTAIGMGNQGTGQVGA